MLCTFCLDGHFLGLSLSWWGISEERERGRCVCVCVCVEREKSEKCQKSNSSWVGFEGPAKFLSLDFLISLFDATPLVGLAWATPVVVIPSHLGVFACSINFNKNKITTKKNVLTEEKKLFGLVYSDFYFII